MVLRKKIEEKKWSRIRSPDPDPLVRDADPRNRISTKGQKCQETHPLKKTVTGVADRIELFKLVR
jgi:hypothetical protein